MHRRVPGARIAVRIALVSDIHGNAMALEPCLARIAALGVDRIHFLGDAVGYMPEETRVLELLEGAGAICQKGNHEHYLLHPELVPEDKEKVYQLRGARSRLSELRLRGLQEWPESRRVVADQLRILMIHGSPENILEGYVYPDSDLSPFRTLDCDVVLMGNTHRPFVREFGGKLFANVGSLGLPRDHGSLASFAVFDTAKRSCVIHRVRIDVDAVTAAYRGRVDDAVLAVFQRTSPHVEGKLIE
jgi:putative phosphoesterase